MAAIKSLGGWCVTYTKHAHSAQVLRFCVGFGGGLLLVVLLKHFLPEVFSLGINNQALTLSVLLGVALVVAADRLLAQHLMPLGTSPACGHTHSQHGDFGAAAGCVSVGCVMVCAFFDGLEIPVAFQLGKFAGWGAWWGLLLHSVPEGILAASLALQSNWDTNSQDPKKAMAKRLWRARLCSLAVGGALLLGGVTSLLLGAIVEFKNFLPLATGVLMYTIFGHLLPAALKTRTGISGLILSALIGSAL